MATYDLVCVSHLRWDVVVRRPQQLLGRAARARRVFYVEEARFGDGVPHLEQRREGDVVVAVPHLPSGTPADVADAMQRRLLDGLLREHAIERYVLWFYAPMALGFTHHLRPLAVVYDCVEEPTDRPDASAALVAREAALLHAADLVFTSGEALAEAKRERRRAVHAFPAGVELPHFAAARADLPEPRDQAAIPRPRIGHFGTIDPRIDLALLAALADARPAIHIVLIGPVEGLSPGALPARPNLHVLGPRTYAELPAYAAGWDVAIAPFVRGELTRHADPPQPLEYLAAGRPVVATAIQGVVRPYGELGLVRVADTPAAFAAAIDLALADEIGAHRRRADRVLAERSWERTWVEMQDLIDRAVRRAERPSRPRIATAPSLRLGAH